MKDSFDNIIKEKLEQLSFDYDPKAWNAVKGKISKPQSFLKYYLGAAAIAILVGGAFMYFNSNKKSKITTPNQDVINSEQTIASNENKNSTAKTKPVTTKDKNNNGSKLGIHPAPKPRIIPPDANYDYFLKPKINGTKANQNNKSKDNISSQASSNKGNTNQTKGQNSNVNKSKNFDNISTIKLSPKASQNVICLSSEVQFSNKAEKDVVYNWNFGDGQSATGAFVSHEYAESGNYTVELTAFKVGNKTQKQSSTIDIEVKSAPKANFNWICESTEHNGNKLFYPYTDLTSSTQGKGSYKWNINNREYAGSSISIILSEVGTYNAKLTFTDKNGCSNSITKEIEIKTPFKPYAPDAFTPNGDGINDSFLPKELKVFDIPFTLTIYNSNHQVVYKTSSANAAWNGEFMNSGSVLPKGTYVWSLITKDYKGVSHTFNGTILLLNK